MFVSFWYKYNSRTADIPTRRKQQTNRAIVKLSLNNNSNNKNIKLSNFFFFFKQDRSMYQGMMLCILGNSSSCVSLIILSLLCPLGLLWGQYQTLEKEALKKSHWSHGPTSYFASESSPWELRKTMWKSISSYFVFQDMLYKLRVLLW